MLKDRPTVLYVLVCIIALACLADLGTLLLFSFNNGIAYETNPIFIFLKQYMGIIGSLIAVIIYKLVINAYIIYLLFNYKLEDKSHVFAFFLVMSAIALILLQFWGSYLNTTTHYIIIKSPPGSIAPLSQKQSYSFFGTITGIYSIYVLVNLLIFKIYEKLYRKEIKKEIIRPYICSRGYPVY